MSIDYQESQIEGCIQYLRKASHSQIAIPYAWETTKYGGEVGSIVVKLKQMLN